MANPEGWDSGDEFPAQTMAEPIPITKEDININSVLITIFIFTLLSG